MSTAAPPKLGPGFEWFVAWRHLRDPERQSRRTLIFGLAILVLSGIALGVSYYLTRGNQGPEAFLQVRSSVLAQNLWRGGIIGVIVGAVVTFLGTLFSAFTVFTAISIFGVFLGTSAPIIALSVMSGFEADLKGKIRGAKADVVVTLPDDRPFTDWEPVRAKMNGIPGLVAATPFLEAEVMIKSGGVPAGIMLRGIDPETAAGVLDVGRAVREGSLDDLRYPERVLERTRGRVRGEAGGFGGMDEAAPKSPPPPASKDPSSPAETEEAILPKPSSAPTPAIILGEELYSRTLRVYVGSEVDILCPMCGMGPTGPRPNLSPFRVAGHFYSGMYEFDSKLAYVDLGEAQRFLGMPGEVSGIDVRTRTPEEAPAVAEALRHRLGPGYDVRSWEELNKGLFMALRLEKIAMFVVMTFIALVASFSIISNLIMLVTEKAREVAILKAMGAGDGAILRIFFAEGLYIGLLGLAVGVSSGILGCKLLERFGPPLPTDVYYISNLPVVMRADEILTVAGSALILCCLATVYPAVLASRMRPVDGLRYE